MRLITDANRAQLLVSSKTLLLPFIFSSIFSFSPLLVLALSIHDSEFIEFGSSSPWIMLWLACFLVIFFTIGLIGLLGVLRSFFLPPQLTLDRLNNKILLRFWGGTTKYDLQAALTDVECLEIVDAKVANEVSLETWQELSVQLGWHNRFWGRILRGSLQWLRDKERQWTQAQAVEASRKPPGELLHGKEQLSTEQAGPYYLLVNFEHGKRRLIRDLSWEKRSDAEMLLSRLNPLLAS